jgi:hypothetical protein
MIRPTIFNRRALGALLLFIMLGSSFFAQARDYTALEIAGLPQYCQDWLNKGGAAKNGKWVDTFGHRNAIHIHHFCYGLMDLARASSEIDANARRGNADRAIKQFDYVLQRWPADFQLYPVAQMYKQQAEIIKMWK